MRIFALYGSTRGKGNSDLLTDMITDGLDCTRVHLKDYNILPIRDQRYDPGGFQPIDDDHPQLVKQMLNHDLLLFATPLYWYGMPGSVKNFIDRWTMYFDDNTFKERMAEKEALVVITGGDNPRLKGMGVLQQLYWIFDFLGITFIDYVIGQGNIQGEVRQDFEAMSKAEHLNHILRTKSRTITQPASIPPMVSKHTPEYITTKEKTEDAVNVGREEKRNRVRELLKRRINGKRS
ncbi:multimeric flavodoxin WrbA [Melghirimyces profundicolus]|uniref:Multimeric flavodoxin WrbA n=1 Tax=Melghirimyces profundicolus TaxID=1242148 RepID=A0A2T6BQX8_9BACL|nr:NAD(P)H-dependent oxidoreductase [Melghirimyces profundicolus]PTX58449.1 multimeric flavodoxin WrbA [Melghirimyces profundicolus]